MSSYFDTASAMFSKAMKDGREDVAEKVAATVRDTYGSYMAWIAKHISTSDGFRLEKLKERWLKLIARPLVSVTDWQMGVSMFIENVHDFAHDVGRSGMSTWRGRPILDNPYVAVRTDLIIEAQRNGQR